MSLLREPEDETAGSLPNWTDGPVLYDRALTSTVASLTRGAEVRKRYPCWFMRGRVTVCRELTTSSVMLIMGKCLYHVTKFSADTARMLKHLRDDLADRDTPTDDTVELLLLL